MAEFDNRVSQIRSALSELIGTIDSADTKLSGFANKFGKLVDEARSVADLVDAVERLDKGLGNLNVAKLEALQTNIREVAAALKDLDGAKISSVADALDRQEAALSRIRQTQSGINAVVSESATHFSRLRTEIAAAFRELDTGDEKLTKISQAFSAKADGGSLREISTNLKAFSRTVKDMDPAQINELAGSLNVLKRAIDNLNKTSFTGPKLGDLDKVVTQLSRIRDLQAQIGDVSPTQAPVKTRTVAQAQAQSTEGGTRNEDLGLINPKAVLKNANLVRVREEAARDAQQVTQPLQADQTPRTIALEIIKQRQRILSELRAEFSTAFGAAGHSPIGEAQYGSISKLLATDPTALSKPENASNPAIRLLNNMLKQRTGIQYNNQALEAALREFDQSLQDRAVRELRSFIGQANKSSPSVNNLGYAWNEVISRRQKEFAYPDAARISLGPDLTPGINFDQRTQTYSTVGNNIRGANTAEATANFESIARAVLGSPNRFAVVGGAGSAAFGAGIADPRAKDAADHIAVAFFDELKKEIRLVELSALEGGQTHFPYTAKAGPESNLAEFSSRYDRVVAVPVNLDEQKATELKESILKNTIGPDASYSFAEKLGNTCASAIASSIREVGLNPDFSKPLAGTNVTTPKEILGYFQRVNAGEDPSKIRSGGALDTARDIYTKYSEVRGKLSDLTNSALNSAKDGLLGYSASITSSIQNSSFNIGSIKNVFQRIAQAIDGYIGKLLAKFVEQSSVTGIIAAGPVRALRGIAPNAQTAAAIRGDYNINPQYTSVVNNMFDQAIQKYAALNNKPAVVDRQESLRSLIREFVGGTSYEPLGNARIALAGNKVSDFIRGEMGWSQGSENLGSAFKLAIPGNITTVGIANADQIRKHSGEEDAASIAATIFHELQHFVTDATSDITARAAGYTNSPISAISTDAHSRYKEAATDRKFFNYGEDYLSYITSPDEVMSHVAEALVTGNQKLENRLRDIYGPELFAKAESALQGIAPDIFAPDALEEMRERFKKFNTDVENLVDGQLVKNIPTTAEIRQLRGYDEKRQTPRVTDVYGNTNNTGGGVIDKVGGAYSKVLYNANQVGSIVNAVQAFFKAITNFSPAGIIDISHAIINTWRALQNIGRSTGVNIVPQTNASAFNRRSSTVLSIVEAGVQLFGGPEFTENIYKPIKQQIREQWRKEQEQTRRAAVAAYDPGDPFQASIRNRVLGNLTPEETLRTHIAESAITRFTGGSDLYKGLGAGFGIVSPQSLQHTYLDAGHIIAENNLPSGASIPYISRKTGQVTSFGFLNEAKASGFTNGEAIAHELIHGLTDGLEAAGKGVFSALETPLAKRRAFLSTPGNFENVKKSVTGDATYGALGQSAFKDQESLDYFLDPKEIYSNIGQSLISGNEKLQSFFRKLYGADLFDKAIAELRSQAPDTFGKDALIKIQERFAEFDQAISFAIQERSEAQLTAAIDFYRQGNIPALHNVIGGTPVPSAVAAAASVAPVSPDVVTQAPRALAGFGTQVSAPTGNVANDVAAFIHSVGPQLNIRAGVQAAAGKAIGENLAAALTGLQIDVPAIRAGLGQGNLGPLKHEAQTALQAVLNGSVQDILHSVSTNESGRSSLGGFIQGLIPQGLIDKVAPLAGKTLLSSPFIQQAAARGFGSSLRPQKQLDLYDEVNANIRGRIGENLDKQSFDVQHYYDFNEGVNRVAVSARTASGSMVSLNGRINEFNELVLDTPRENALSQFLQQVAIELPRELTRNAVYGLIGSFQELFHTIVGIQDELAEVGTLLDQIGSKSQGLTEAEQRTRSAKARSDFLYSSIDTAVQTAQPFQEAIQTNIQNFKVLAPVKDERARLAIANKLSTVQLGAQTAFGIGLQESLESIPAIFTQIRDSIPKSVTDPAVRASVALDQLQGVMSKLVVAQRESGAAGSDLIQVYAQLAASAEDVGLSQNKLLALTAAVAVKLNKSPVETADSVKAIIERTYGAGADDLAKLGIAVKQVGADGTIEFRAFDQILGDINKKIEESPSKAKEFAQALGSQRRASEAQKIISAFPEYQRIEGTLNPVSQGGEVQGNEFDVLIERKKATFAGAINTMQASFGLFLQQILFGSGAMDDLAKTIEHVSGSIRTLAELAKSNPQIVEQIKNAIYGVILVMSAILARGLNLFSVVATVINTVVVRVRALISAMTSGARAFIAPVEGVSSALQTIFQALEGSGVDAFKRIANSARESQGAIQLVAEAAREATAGVKGLENVNAFLTGVTSKPTAPGVSGFWNGAAGKTIRNVGETAGQLAVPVGIDLLTGGLKPENLVNIGAGIAGGFAGSIAGPTGTIVGYTIAKSFAEGVDVYGIFGTSDKEKERFASAYAKINANPTLGLDPAARAKADADAKAQLAKEQTDNFAALDKKFNFSAFIKQYDTVKAQFPVPVTRRELETSTARLNTEAFQGFGDLKKLFDESQTTNVEEFIQLLKDAQSGETDLGKLVKDRGELEKAINDYKAEQNNLSKDGIPILETANATLEKTKKITEDLQNKQQYQFAAPRGLTEFGDFGSVNQRLQAQFLPKFQAISSGRIGKDEGNQIIEQFTQRQQALQGIPQILATATPVAQELGQNIDGIQRALYQAGSEGQSAFSQTVNQLSEMIKFSQEYEAIQEQIATIQASPVYKDPAGGEDRAKLQEELVNLEQQKASRAGLYQQYAAYLGLVRASPDLLSKELGVLKAQQSARKSITTGGSPAQFQAPSIFNVEDYTTQQLTDAINAAREKQDTLAGILPQMRAEFQKQQFLLESGGQYKSVQGISQQFIQQFLQQQQKEQLKTPNITDLREFSPEKQQQIISRARDLQAQAVKQAPDLGPQYDKERLLILGKNNNLLLQLGLSEEYLKLAIDENTKSQDELRGHFNLPSGYRAPTVWDYYANGGRETGNVNYPGPKTGDNVPLSLAKNIADAVLKGGTGTEGQTPNLGALGNLKEPGAAPLGYPNPGTAAVKVDIPDTVDQFFVDQLNVKSSNLKDNQLDVFDRHPEILKSRNTPATRRTYSEEVLEKYAQYARSQQQQPSFGTSGGGGGGSWGGAYNGGGGSWGEDARSIDALGQSGKKSATTIDTFRSNVDTASTALEKVRSIANIAGLLNPFTVGAAAATLGLSSFTTTLAAAIQRLGQFDLARALQQANIKIDVVVNGQAQQQARVTIGGSSSGGGTQAYTAQGTSGRRAY